MGKPKRMDQITIILKTYKETGWIKGTPRPFDLHYRYEGHRISVCTVDMDAGWEEIEGRLLSIVRD
jgi:hypothetical protein